MTGDPVGDREASSEANVDFVTVALASIAPPS
jgi:hypothetical protein